MDSASSSAQLATAQPDPCIDPRRLDARLEELGRIGQGASGGRTRLALTSEDKDGRDLVVRWLREAGARVCVDRIGNIYGVAEGKSDAPPIMTGSHIDTVARAGALDGCYGVVAGIEVLRALRDRELRPHRRIVVAAFTSEEGARFTPDLLGSRVLAKDISLEAALALQARDGAVLGEELRRIGYAGEISPWELLPHAFVELHIEQGPILDAEQVPIGVVEGVQGHSWWHAAVVFDPELCALIEAQAQELGLATRRMSSGASHDAQMMARLCPTAMIFVPSYQGISHNPREHTDSSQLQAGANLLLHSVLRLASC